MKHVIPAPSKMNDIDPIKVARQVDPAGDSGECFVNMVAVDVKEYAKKHFEKKVKKTLSIPSWLNELAEEKDVNFSKVLKEALIEKLL